MDYKKDIFIKMKVNSKVSAVFTNIISDIPYPSFRTGGTALIKQAQNTIISYEDFYNIVYKCVLEYIPKKDENLLVKIIVKFPKAIKNVQRINENSEIIKLQHDILNKYFYNHGDMNLRDKINELKIQVNELIELGDLEYLETILDRFEERMRNSFLCDMKKLSQLLENR